MAQAVPASLAPFLHNTDSSLNLWDVLISTRQVVHRATRHRLNHNLLWRKFAIGMQYSDSKYSLEIVGVNLFESLEDVWNGPVRKIIDRRETNFPAECKKERDLIHKEYIGRQKHFVV